MSDRNKLKFILNTSGLYAYFNVLSHPPTDLTNQQFSDLILKAEYFSHNSASASDDGSIQEFLQNDEINVLAVTSTENALRFLHSVPTEENSILFYKIPQLGAVQAKVDIPIGILTLEGGLVKSIYNSVSRVYAPNVTKVKDFL